MNRAERKQYAKQVMRFIEDVALDHKHVACIQMTTKNGTQIDVRFDGSFSDTWAPHFEFKMGFDGLLYCMPNALSWDEVDAAVTSGWYREAELRRFIDKLAKEAGYSEWTVKFLRGFLDTLNRRWREQFN